MLVGNETVETTLQRIVDVAGRCMVGSTGCSVTLPSPNRTAVATSDAVRTIDAQEYALNEGPCIAAMATKDFQRVEDAGADQVFPRFADVLRSEGVGSAIGVPLVIGDEVLGALNVYAAKPHAFGRQEELDAQLLADQAAVVLANTRSFTECGERVRQLQEALDTRVVIEQAKGVVMERERCDAEQAFEILKTQSQHTNRKLRLVAAEVLESVRRAS